jgi:beta-glucosidase/6-phospho-beta-glucosidase/beta-galactosidase
MMNSQRAQDMTQKALHAKQNAHLKVYKSCISIINNQIKAEAKKGEQYCTVFLPSEKTEYNNDKLLQLILDAVNDGGYSTQVEESDNRVNIKISWTIQENSVVKEEDYVLLSWWNDHVWPLQQEYKKLV